MSGLKTINKIRTAWDKKYSKMFKHVSGLLFGLLRNIHELVNSQKDIEFNEI
jgi:hypothetical protein